MNINLIVIGRKMPKWIQTGIDFYQKQLPNNFKLTLLEAQKRKGKNIAQIKKIEGELLINASKNSNLIIAFDETGKQQSTVSIAKKLTNWQQNGDNVSMLIGGTDGLDDNCKKHVNELWGLSNLTLPHSIARLIVVEQIYRAYSILNNHPYHRE